METFFYRVKTGLDNLEDIDNIFIDMINENIDKDKNQNYCYELLRNKSNLCIYSRTSLIYISINIILHNEKYIIDIDYSYNKNNRFGDLFVKNLISCYKESCYYTDFNYDYNILFDFKIALSISHLHYDIINTEIPDINSSYMGLIIDSLLDDESFEDYIIKYNHDDNKRILYFKEKIIILLNRDLNTLLLNFKIYNSLDYIILIYWVIKYGLRYSSLLENNEEYFLSFGNIIFQKISDNIESINLKVNISLLQGLIDIINLDKRILNLITLESLFIIYKKILTYKTDYVINEFIDKYIKTTNCLYLSEFSLKMTRSLLKKSNKKNKINDIICNDLIFDKIIEYLIP